MVFFNIEKKRIVITFFLLCGKWVEERMVEGRMIEGWLDVISYNI